MITCPLFLHQKADNFLRPYVRSSGIRKPGGGRKKLIMENPEMVGAIEKLIEPATRGDPMSPLRWSCKSVRNLEKSLQKSGYSISYRTIATILHEQEYRLQSNRKTSEGKKNHPDRNEQFGYINKQATSFLRREEPVISVDAKKKELIGKYKNPGREWRKKGKPVKVLSHDFPDPAVPKAVPYGVYDIGRNTGWVNVGVDADTAEFAVESIRQWWRRMGKQRYPQAKELLICADSGGSNGYRSHLWKCRGADGWLQFRQGTVLKSPQRPFGPAWERRRAESPIPARRGRVWLRGRRSGDGPAGAQAPGPPGWLPQPGTPRSTRRRVTRRSRECAGAGSRP